MSAVSSSVALEIVTAQPGTDRLGAERGNINLRRRSSNIKTGNCKSGGGRQPPRVCVLGTGPFPKRATFVLCPAFARG